jgi:hypothetical protein
MCAGLASVVLWFSEARKLLRYALGGHSAARAARADANQGPSR